MSAFATEEVAKTTTLDGEIAKRSHWNLLPLSKWHAQNQNLQEKKCPLLQIENIGGGHIAEIK